MVVILFVLAWKTVRLGRSSVRSDGTCTRRLQLKFSVVSNGARSFSRMLKLDIWLLLRFNSLSTGSRNVSSNLVNLLRCNDNVTRLLAKYSKDLGNSTSRFWSTPGSYIRPVPIRHQHYLSFTYQALHERLENQCSPSSLLTIPEAAASTGPMFCFWQLDVAGR